MKIKCINNTGKALRLYENKTLKQNEFGRFGATANTEFGELEIGKIYLVMGIIIFDSYQAYLIDDGIDVFTAPCQLFEIIDDKIDMNWHFRLIEKDEDIYPFVQTIFGYLELCSDKKSYEKLIIERDKDTIQIYFKRKKEAESIHKNTNLPDATSLQL